MYDDCDLLFVLYLLDSLNLTSVLDLFIYLSICTQFELFIAGTGTLCWPTPERIWDMMPWRKSIVEERGELQPRFLMSVSESVESFLYGMGRVFLAIVILVSIVPYINLSTY